MKGELTMGHGDRLILADENGVRMVEIQKMGKTFFIDPIPNCVVEAPGEGCGSTTISARPRWSSSLTRYEEQKH
jgi:hypothetical protein